MSEWQPAIVVDAHSKAAAERGIDFDPSFMALVGKRVYVREQYNGVLPESWEGFCGSERTFDIKGHDLWLCEHEILTD